MPLTDDVKVISVDDHIVEPPHVWQGRLPERYREDAPHIIEDPDTHDQVWVWEGRRYPLVLMGSPKTRVFTNGGGADELRTHRYDGVVPGVYDAKARVAAMDEDGIHAQVNFPTFPRFAGTLFLQAQDKELAHLIVKAYNDWLIDDWCATAPDRFIASILLPLWDPQASAAEIRRCRDKGALSISFPENPAPLGLPSYWTRNWDPVFDAAIETGMPLSMHIGTSGGLPHPAPESSENVEISLCGLNSMETMADLVFSGILQRFPNIKIALSEGGAGWVPYIVERMQYTWERTRMEVDRSVSPRELYDRHFWTCFISDDVGITLRHDIGIKKLMFETDYPHNDTNWPDSRKVLAKMLADVPDDEARRIAELNARELYNFWS
ncbi:amidohydrolase family protein [Pseudonocardia xishanensis]|uniref:Amidohydrolase family protein n=1 Tax=Pseudonocardia xishanensis TaxID=630995 RepID=A0ABP8RU51_9PSEU